MDLITRITNLRNAKSATTSASPEEQLKQAAFSHLSSQNGGANRQALQKVQAKFNQKLMATSPITNKTQAIPVDTPEPTDNRHFLNRISYGPTVMDLEEINDLGWENVLEQQLNPDSIDTSELENALHADFPTLSLSPKELYTILEDGGDIIGQIINELIGATLARQTFSPAQLYERMVEFWSDHFNMNILVDPVYLFKSSDDRDNIRPHALGKFSDLLHANAASPAMLFYLDNYSNTKSGPNENYARELLELHTLGVDGGYTEADVVNVARAFTGWTVDYDSLEFTFYMGDHDRLKKTVLGKKLKHPATGGVNEGKQVLDLLAAHPSTAHFLSTKLARRFVGDSYTTELVDTLTQTFIETDGDIKVWLGSLFEHPDFWASKEQKMKRPLDYLTSMIRRLGFENNEDSIGYMEYKLEQLSQIPYFWHAPNGYPDKNNYWTNTSALITRWGSGNDLAYYIPYENLEAILDGKDTPNQIIQAMAIALFDQPLGKQQRRIIKQNVFHGQKPNQPIDGDPVDFAIVIVMVLLATRYFQMR